MKKHSQKFYRHGDVFLKKIEEIPEGLQKVESDALWFGEHGHTHRLTGDVSILERPDSSRFITVGSKGGTLTHEEHKRLDIGQGYYQVVIEREFDPCLESIRQVID